MSSKRKFNRKSKYTLSQKIISAVTAAGFIMQPFTAFAGEIVKPGGQNLINNNVANIWADRVVDKTAVNVFNKFNLSQNEIANMYFGTSQASHGAENLVNFVNDRIDINGTVNAIQNKQIGGNLFFLSSDGMAVGKSGVINTGSLYVMTPTQNFMETATKIVGNPTDTGAKAALDNVVDTAKWQAIPVNASGTITVLGQVNATNEVQMRAAKIGVGKNVDDKVVDEVASGKTDATNAIIQTGVTNFGDLVNIKGVDGAEDVKSGLTGELIATKTGSGDIILEAYVDNKSNPNAVENIPQIGGVLSDIVDWGENNFKTQNFDASVDVYGEVNAAGEADITATAVNSNVDVDDLGNYVDNKNTDVAQLANVNANVNIGNGGTVTAEKAVTVKAEAINRYVDNTGAFETALKLGVSSGSPLTGDAAYSKLDTDATINIEQGATVSSTGGNVNIDAKAETLAASAASTLGLKFKTVGGYKGANVPAAAVVYTEAHNDAKVTVNGDVTAKNDVTIDADADLTVEAENKMTVTGEKANQFVVGVTIANASNNADVTIGGEGSSVTATDGNLAVNAKAGSDFTSKTSISAGESSAVGVAINVTNFNSGANVTVDTDLKAGKDLTVNAADTIAADNVMAESKVGSGKYMSSAMQVMGKNGSIDAVKGFASDLAKKMLLPEMSDDIKGVSVADVLHAGATVTYSGQNHNSGVTIGNDASLTADGKLDIDAQTKIEDAHFTATGATNSYNDATAAPVTLNAAVLVTNMNNSSSVVVEDAATENGTEHKATLNGANGVDINAATKFEYNRVQKMKDAVTDAAAQIEHAFTTLDKAFKDDFDKIPDEFKNLKDKYTAAYEAFTGKMNGIEDGTQVTSGAYNFIDAIVAGYQVLTALEDLNAMLDESGGSEVMKNATEAFKGASDLFSGALAFVDPNSYGTFAAASTSKGSSGDVGGSAPGGGSVTGAVGGSVASAVNGAGAVMVNTVNSVSKVEIGSDTVIESDRDVNIGAENYMKDVSLGGLNLGLFNNAGGGTSASIGATVNYAQFDTETIVAVNDGAKITGGNIDIDAKNTIDHVSVAASAGKGPSAQTESDGVVINGMLSFVNGSSDILTVVDDGASLTAKQNNYTETVKDEETGKETEETKTTEGNISINGHNNTNITNVAAGASWGKGSAAVGVGLAYTDFEVKNITGVADVAEQIKGLYATNSDGTVNDKELEEAKKKFSNTYDENADANDGIITAYGFSVDAATDGSIQSVSAAGTLSNDDASGQIGFFDKINSGLNSLDQKLVGQGGLVDKASSSFLDNGTNGEKMNGFFTMGQKTHGADNANKGGINIVNTTTGAGGKQVNTFMPSFSLAGSGSVSVNMLDNATEAIVDNAKITMKKTGEDKGDISVTARDTLYAGAYSGAAAVQWNAGGSSGDKSVSVSGAAGVNDIANAVKATIKNSAITNAGELNTMALSGGEQLALGLGMAVVKADGTTGYSGNAAVSVNLIDHDVEALLENNTVTDTDDVNVVAYARDIENAGGGGLTLGQQKVGVGATVGVAMLNNNISAGIKGGSYEDVGNVDVEALNALQNITVGIAAGVTAPSGNGGNANVQGAGVYNEVHNTTNAFITGNSDTDKVVITTVEDKDETGEVGNVNVTAQDVAIDKNSLYEELFKKIDMSDVGNELGSGETVSLIKDSGSNIITVAGSIAGSTGKAAVGGAAAITDIENNYTANIDYANITTESLTAEAGSDSNIVTVAGGVAAANKGSGVGSVSWNDVDNTAKVDIKNSVVKAQNTAATAKNTAQIVSVGGQVSASGKAGVGATLSYVGLDNSTEANITDTTFDKRDTSETNGITVKAEAQNTSDSYNVGFGIAAGSTAAVTGTVVVTQTHGTAGAVMDKVTINDAKEVTANALDDTDILSVIGNVTGSGKAAVGAGVAYTEIGDVSTNPDNGQYVTAEIKNNSTINSVGAGSKVDVKAKDEAHVINVAVGVGGAANAAVQGASATTLINKTTSAAMNNTGVYSDETGSKKADVTVEAQNDSEITSSADVAAAAASGAGVGAGIAVNRIIQQTNAAVNGGTMNVNNLTVNANATPQITNIGVGIGVAGSGAGVTGSVAVNMIENDVTAHIGSGANIAANNYVGVVATSDEQIANYAGQASVAGSGAAVGLSVSYNELTGSTTATIDGDTTSVSASNGDALKVKDSVADNSILDDVVDEDAFDSQNTLGDGRVESEYKGVAVSASSTHAIKSFIINGGVAGTGAAVNGTVNVNQIGGSTKAAITGADINTAGTASDVNVIAHDYTNSAGMVGTASIAGTGAGVGLGSDTNTVSREVTAEVSGANTINAAGFNVEAEAKQGISSLTVSAAGAGIGAGVSNATSVALLNGKTTAKVNNANITASSMNVTANHTGKLNTMGTVLGAGGLGAGVGVGVSVLNEDSTTTADVSSSDITINNAESSDNNINITAANTTKVNYQLYSVGGALAGVAGAIGVSNVNSKVNTNVANVAMDSSEADDINIGAENTIDFTNTSGSGAGGAVGVGVGVAVNTIDSKVTTTVDDSELNAANDINVTANETRKVKQEAVNAGAGAVAGGANVMITNVGSAVADSYGSGLQTDDNGKVEDGSGINTNTIFDEANKAVAGNQLKDGYTFGVEVNDAPDVTAKKGADNASVVEVKINDATLNAGNKVTAEAVADTNVTMNAVQASGGAYISASGTVGILDVNRNSVVNISNTNITAQDLAVSTTQKGASKLDIYQGNVGGKASIGAAYGSASSTGVNNIRVSGSTLNIGGSVDINANDESKTAVNAIGVTLAGGGAASVIVAQGSNDSSTNIEVKNTDINAGEDINISAERKAKDENGNKLDTLSVSAKAASGGLIFAGVGVGATADELGKVGVEVTGGSNFTAGKAINITALNAPSVKAETGSLSASMIASGAITVAEANIGTHIETEDKENENKEDNGHLKTIVNISDGNSFTAESLTAEAKADAVQNVIMNGISISASLPMFPSGAVQANTGGAEAYSDVTVSVGKNVFKGNGTEAAANGINLNINGVNSVDQDVTAKGIYASSYFASGTNDANSKAVLTTDVKANGSKTYLDAEGKEVESDVNDLIIRADSNADITTTAQGDGGGLVGISPNAAGVDNDYKADTDVTLSGNWNTAGAVEATASNGGTINLLADALQAAVIGASGVWLDNSIDNQADVNVTGATVNADGGQNYLAQNIADYDGDIKGSGYGGVAISGTQLRDTFNYGANVNIKDSTLHGAGDEGSITAQALTEGTISSYNVLKSAGVIPVSVADSEHKITYDNAVNVENSELITDKKNQDITLAASDNTDVDLNTTADTQGGLVGAASAKATNNFNRYNDVKVYDGEDGEDGEDTYIESANDVNLYAGVNADGEYSSLNLNVIADAYNRTALPLATDPSVTNNMSQNNKVTVESDVASVRHINAKAVKGNTTIAKSANVYKNIGGGGKGSVTTTAGGKDEGTDEVYNNGISVTGALTAGIHNKLDISISGATETNLDQNDAGYVNEENSGVSYEGINIEIAEGQDWLTEDQITPTEVKIFNNLKDEYNALAGVISQYPIASQEYKNLRAAMDALEEQMLEAGFWMVDDEGKLVGEPLSHKTVLGIELPDIVVSGGNINFETDNLSGTGSVTAQGAPQINISNSSDLYLKVNDITIQDNGGIVRLNGSEMSDGKLGGFTGSVNVPGDQGTASTPEINITSTSAEKFDKNRLAQPDIAIYGDIVNAVGDINISSSHHDITINENAQLSARNISLSAEQGSVTQNSTDGILNVGGDPVTQYQFSEDVATKVQEYVNGQLREAHEKGEDWSISFATRDEYIEWLIEKVGVTEEELGITKLDETAGIDAGNNVYINALDVNINGLVQAGYGKYLSNLGADAITKIDNINDKYSNENFNDSEVFGNSEFLVNKGGKVWDEINKVWNYEIAVYYNPTTKKLLVDNVNVNGGQIYITGNVSSTGNGRLMAMDGAADITVDTTAVTNNVKGVVVNNITNKNIEGLISITDTNVTKDSNGREINGLVTEYKNGQWREYAVGTAVEDRPGWTDGSKTEYSPEKGLSYQYTGGYKSGEVNYKYYTKDFLFWTGLEYDQSTTIEDAIKKDDAEAIIHVKTETYENGNANGTGTFIAQTDGQQGSLMISGSYVKGEEGTPSAVTTNTTWGPPEWLGYIGGYGRITYSWTTENATTSSTTASIKADNKIQIGFLGNDGNNGDISITGNQNIELAGNITNAEVDGEGIGSVNLTSNNGSVSAIGSANINSDDVNIKAATGVNVNHSAIGDSANINIATDSGDIKFVSTGGDLNIEQAVTGGTNPIDATTGSVYLEAQGNLIDATTGSVYLEAQGNLIDAATGSYAVKGQRIDLISNSGNIGSLNDDGTVAKEFRVLGGSELYSSDTMASSVNAQAQGDIVLTQVDNDNVAANGSSNMRLGTIVSENGDAVLTVNDGSFVDAHPSENSDSSSAQDKIDRWLEAGLIVEKDCEGKEVSADDSTASAEQAKAERVNALTDRMKALAAEGEHSVEEYKTAAGDFYKDEGISAAKAAYLDAVAEADGEQAEIEAAYMVYKDAYKSAQEAYFDGKDFTEAEQQLISSYAEVANSDNYGWSKNQLLYAIQDSVLNSAPGKDVLTVETPNVTANNITLNASAGGVGIDGAAQFISNDNLNIEENLKLLAAAKAGDLTWGENGVTIRQQQAITVSVNEKADGTYGNVNVDANKNVYLAGVKDTQLNITGVDTDGNIRLQGDKGINVSDMLSGKDLTLTGGSGDIMGNDVINDVGYIKTDVTGNVYANADGDINIHHIGGTDDAGDIVDLKLLAIATNNVANLKAENSILMYTDPNAEAQGRINADIVNLTAGGAIGEEDNAIRILDNGAVVNADAEDDIYLSGVSGEGSTGELVLGTVEGENLDVTSVSSIKQTADGKITANEVNASATENILLGSEKNDVNSFVVTGLGENNSVDGSIDLASKANNADGVVNVEFGKDVNGNKVGLTVNNGYVNVSSLGDTSNLNITGGSVTTTGENAGGVSFSSGGGINADVVVNSATDVDFNVNSGDITLGGNLTANNGNITIDIAGKGDLKDAENKDNTLKAISLDGDEAKGNIVINVGRDKNGAGDVDLYDLYASNEARVDVNNGDLTLHEINGQLVAIQLRTEGKEMDVGEIIAGTQIVLSGSNMDLDQITQREDADGMLVITPDGAEEDKPIDNFTIGNIQTNDNKGIRFDRLWVNNSYIHMNQGQLWFDKLYVEDTAHFSTGDMTAAVYGVPPLRDGSDSVYWNNTAENRPEDNLDLWQSGTGDWMYLRFTDDNIQESNGILLTLDEYDYVYDQRFTAEDHMRWQHGRYLDEDWKQAYGYGLSLHDRYGLIDYQHFTEENAGEDEIAVEA